MLARDYLRVSKDSSGRQRSNAEQRTKNREAWSDFEWGEPYSDATSASRFSRRGRDDFAQLMTDLSEDAFGAEVLVLWESSRGSRDVGEWCKLIDVCEERGVKIAVTTHSRVYDCSNARDRRTLQEDAIDSEYESAKISQRIRRNVASNAVERRPHGRVLFGYRRVYEGAPPRLVGQEPDPEQAPVVRRVYAQYLAGRSARSIAAELNDHGVKTRRGNGWTPLMIHRMLTNRSYLGHRVHNGEDFGEGWIPIIDLEAFEQAAARREATSWRKPQRAKALCSGLVLCGECRDKMHVKRSGATYYGCVNYHAYRRADQLDAFVAVAVLERLSRPDIGEALSGSEDPRVTEARSQAVEAQAELDEAMVMWKAKKLSTQSFVQMEAHLKAQIQAAERVIRRSRLPLKLDVPAAEAVPAWWDGLTDEVRREVLAALVVAVVVQPTGRGRRKIDWLEATAIDWRR